MLTTSTDDPSLEGARLIIKVPGHQYQWLAWWLWPGNRTFLKVASMLVTWWIVAFLRSEGKNDPALTVHSTKIQLFTKSPYCQTQNTTPTEKQLKEKTTHGLDFFLGCLGCLPFPANAVQVEQACRAALRHLRHKMKKYRYDSQYITKTEDEQGTTYTLALPHLLSSEWKKTSKYKSLPIWAAREKLSWHAYNTCSTFSITIEVHSKNNNITHFLLYIPPTVHSILPELLLS